MRLRYAAEFPLPLAVQNHPIDMAALRTGLPAVRLRCREADVHGRANRIIGIEHGLDRIALSDFRARNGGRDAVAGAVGQFLVQQ